MDIKHFTLKELQSRTPLIFDAPKDNGKVKLIVSRPGCDERLTHNCINISPELGVHGDRWVNDCWLSLPDGSSQPDVQVCIMNSRVIEAITDNNDRWALAGDNFFIDMDLGKCNLQPGQQLSLGTSIVEITSEAHNACKKFVERFGSDAAKFTNNRQGRENRFRGIYAKVIKAGEISLGDEFTKLY